jgi:uncharacterized membrane protein YeaQ/YmgE (transglycosylase-associated protein family)
LTIVAWVLMGAVYGLLARVVMPVPRDGGNLAPVIAGVSSACVGGGLAVFFLGGGLFDFNPYSVAWAANAALYTLFAYRCFAMRAS